MPLTQHVPISRMALTTYVEINKVRSTSKSTLCSLFLSPCSCHAVMYIQMNQVDMFMGFPYHIMSSIRVYLSYVNTSSTILALVGTQEFLLAMKINSSHLIIYGKDLEQRPLTGEDSISLYTLFSVRNYLQW